MKTDKTTTPEPLTFIDALDQTQIRYRAHPHFKKLEGTPWENDAAVIAADMMVNAVKDHLSRIQELEDQVKALRDAQSKPIQGEVDGWISVDDRLPEYGNPVLIVVLDITSMGYREKITGGGHMWFYIDGDPISYSEEPTHWQPLPPPPVRASPQ